MRISFVHPAPENAVYASDAFDGQIGETVPIGTEDGATLSGQLVASRVSGDGRSVEVTMDVPDGLRRHCGTRGCSGQDSSADRTHRTDDR